MRSLRVLLLGAMCVGAWAQTATWDTSGNKMLNGTYYFRHVTYVLSSAGTGQLYDALALYGSVTFNGAGTYSMSATLADGLAPNLQRGTLNGTYSIASSGQGFLSNPLSSGDSIYGMVNAQGIFAGSSTENQSGFNDLFIATPLAPPVPTTATFKGSYSLAYMDLSSKNPLYTIGGILQMTPDGAGKVGAATLSAYQGQSGSAKGTQSYTNVSYIFSNGAAVVTFPNSTTAVITGQYYLYFSPDGNFVFGGSPVGFDLFIGVRTGTGTPSLGGLYLEAGIDQDESTLSLGYADLDGYYGSMSANAGTIVGHQRIFNVFNQTPNNYTYSEPYTVPANGAYSTGYANYVVASGIRIRSGIGPYLGIGVALQAPSMDAAALSPSGVFLNPQGVVNAGSFAPFTAALAPGELLTVFGANMASTTEVAASVPFPSTLGKTQVTINGIAAPLYYVTPTQLSAIVPYGVTGTVANVQVTNDGVASNTISALLAKTAPGVLTQQQNGLGYGDVVHLDGSLMNSKNPAQPGETLLVFLTGLGAVNPAISDGAPGPTSPLSQTVSTINAYIGAATATVTYAGLAPQLAGLYQINLTVPATGVTPGDNYLEIVGSDGYTAQSLIAIAGAAASDAGTESVRRAAKPAARRRATVPASPGSR
ncbi:MAG: IPT/TIG domain-containing protein [Candidatus Solibacter sp.]